MEWLLGGGLFLFYLFAIAFVAGSIALFVYALVDAIRMPNDASFKAGTQLVWILVILLAQGIGAIIYLVVGRPPGGATGAHERLPASPTAPPPPAGTVV